MAVLGKRKASEPAAATVSEEDANEIFRRHFEARFAPIETPQEKRRRAAEDGDEDDDDSAGAVDEEEDGSDDSEWGGLSEDEISDDDNEDDGDEEEEVEVVDHSTSQTPKATTMSKRDLKAFMSSRPPDPTAKSQPDTKPSQTTTPTSTLPEDAPSLLAQDLELRRLLSESHLLSSPTLSTTTTTAAEPKLFTSGRIRAKANDLRMQALGSQTSIFKQEKMPMNMRKAMVANAEAREEKRRREARENGIILERPAAGGKKSKGRERKREIGVDRPGMGRLRGAELRLNEHDVKKIEGSRDTFGRKGGKRR